MFCHKCGKRLNKDDKFCDSCGASVSVEEVKHDHPVKSAKRSDLEKKAWYRAVKVIFILATALAVLTITIASWTSRPVNTIDNEKSLIRCSNGNFYAPGNNSIYIYGEEMSSYNDEHARILCAYDTTSYYSSQYYNKSIPLNYTFNPVFEEKEYGSWFGYTVLAYFITWAVFQILKLSFFYISIGEKPKLSAVSIPSLD